jgi:hypothetical protein
MYLDTTILQSRTTDTLIDFIDEVIEKLPCDNEQEHSLLVKYKEIKKQQRKAKKLDNRGISLSQE